MIRRNPWLSPHPELWWLKHWIECKLKVSTPDISIEHCTRKQATGCAFTMQNTIALQPTPTLCPLKNLPIVFLTENEPVSFFCTFDSSEKMAVPFLSGKGGVAFYLQQPTEFIHPVTRGIVPKNVFGSFSGGNYARGNLCSDFSGGVSPYITMLSGCPHPPLY